MGLEHVLVAGGGSGGHVFPALAVAEELMERGWRVSWLGRVEGMERDLVEQRRLQYYGLPAKAVVGRTAWQRAAAVASLGVSSWRARRLIRECEVGVVLGTGGFVSVPGVLGAVLARRPVVLLEPNAVPGVANRWMSRWADAAAVASTETARELRCAVDETGVPVRHEFSLLEPSPSLSGPLRLLVLGGSQGARQLNLILPSALSRLAPEYPELEVIHQVGASLVDEARQAYDRQELAEMRFRIVPFVEDMAATMAAADLVISRAGAVTLAEICAAGRPALLLPLQLAGAHQMANARRLVDTGGARLLPSTETSAEDLAEALDELLADRPRLAQMGMALRGLARPQAAEMIADLVARVSRTH